MPKVMVLGCRAYGRWLGNDNGALMNDIHALVKEHPESQLRPSTIWEHSGTNQEVSPHQNIPISPPWSSTFQPSEL